MINNMPTKDFAQYIKYLAKKHNVVYERTYADAFADKATELAGDEVITDEIDDLLVALKRAGIIDGKELVDLLGGYLYEKKCN